MASRKQARCSCSTFISIIVQQRDLPDIVWMAAVGALAIAVMIIVTWGQRGRRTAVATQG